MTKVRSPLTFENALTKVAGVIGWSAVAQICGNAENTVRNWSDQDTTAKVPLEAAYRLDVAYKAAAGQGEPPFLQCYAVRLDTALMATAPCRKAMIAGAARAAKESGEAIAATLIAAGPHAGEADLIVAEREIEESLAAHTSTLATVRATRSALRGNGGPAP